MTIVAQLSKFDIKIRITQVKHMTFSIIKSNTFFNICYIVFIQKS